MYGLENQSLPIVTIVTPMLGRENFQKTLSLIVKNQTYPNIEHLIIEEKWSYNKKSTVIKNARYQLIDIPEGETVSLGYKYRLANKIASGDIIVRMDSDNYYGPDYVEQMVNLLINNKALYGCKTKTYIYDITTQEYIPHTNSGAWVYYRTAIPDEWIVDDKNKAEDVELWTNARQYGEYVENDSFGNHLAIRHYTKEKVKQNIDINRQVFGTYMTQDDFVKEGGHVSAHEPDGFLKDNNLELLSSIVKDEDILNFYRSFKV